MKNSDMPAMPCGYNVPSNSSDPLATPKRVDAKGLTKLEHFAGMAMQGYIAADEGLDHGPNEIAEWSCENAKALLEELEKQKT